MCQQSCQSLHLIKFPIKVPPSSLMVAEHCGTHLEDPSHSAVLIVSVRDVSRKPQLLYVNSPPFLAVLTVFFIVLHTVSTAAYLQA